MVPEYYRAQLMDIDREGEEITVSIRKDNLRTMAEEFAPFLDITRFERYRQLIELAD